MVDGLPTPGQLAAERKELAETAADLRARAGRLHEIGDGLEREASRLEAAVSGADAAVLRGRDITDALLGLVDVGHVFHYKDAERLLRGAGFVPAGVDPAATLLAQLSRYPEFERVFARSGRYRRVDPAKGASA